MHGVTLLGGQEAAQPAVLVSRPVDAGTRPQTLTSGPQQHCATQRTSPATACSLVRSDARSLFSGALPRSLCIAWHHTCYPTHSEHTVSDSHSEHTVAVRQSHMAPPRFQVVGNLRYPGQTLVERPRSPSLLIMQSCTAAGGPLEQ